MEPVENDVSIELKPLVVSFESLSGDKKLEFIKVVIEKLENGEIEIGGKEIYAADIGIEDGFSCCREILKLLKHL